MNREYSSGQHKGLWVSFKWCTIIIRTNFFSELEQDFLDSFDRYSPAHGYNIYGMEKQKHSTVSIAMNYATFVELLQVYQHIYTIYCIHIRYGSSRLTDHQFILTEILLHTLARLEHFESEYRHHLHMCS